MSFDLESFVKDAKELPPTNSSSQTHEKRLTSLHLVDQRLVRVLELTASIMENIHSRQGLETSTRELTEEDLMERLQAIAALVEEIQIGIRRALVAAPPSLPVLSHMAAGPTSGVEQVMSSAFHQMSTEAREQMSQLMETQAKWNSMQDLLGYLKQQFGRIAEI